MAEATRSSVLQQHLDSGKVTPPTEHGMPDLLPDPARSIDSLSDLLVEDRDKERRG